MLITVFVFLLILSILVYVHEFGHFIVAKLNGVKVWEFAFGFKPRLFAKKIGETTYAINAIPLGGYVKLYGEDEAEQGPQAYKSKKIYQRFLILVAGAFMNLVLAWLVLIVLFASGFDPLMPGVSNNPFVATKQRVEVVRLVEDSPAALSGLKEGDAILAVNGQQVSTDQEFITNVNLLRGQLIQLEVARGSDVATYSLEARLNPPTGQGALGVAIRSAGEVKTSLLVAPVAAFYETGRIIGLSAKGVGDFAKNLVVEQKISEDVTGIIGIGALTGITRRLGIEYLAQLLVVVSIGLGVINLVPILPLDGGHIAALAYEKVMGRPMNEKQLGALAMAGMAIVLLLFVIVTYKDIVRFQVIERLF